MSRSQIALCLVVVCGGVPASAKPWQGITPGVSNNLDVIGKFGDPSKTLNDKGQITLVYSQAAAIKGSLQAQFKLNANKVVERIDVYPSVSLDVAAIEKAYGPRCTPETKTACYVEKRAPSKARYFVYSRLGLAVFFKDDGEGVKNLVFLPGEET